MKAVLRKPNSKTSATHKRQNGTSVEVDEIDIRPDVRHLIVVRVPADIDDKMMAKAQQQLAKQVGASNLVIVVPQGVHIEVIALEGVSQEQQEERSAKAAWNF